MTRTESVQPKKTLDSAPMKPTRFYVLLALAKRHRHGLGIMRDVLAVTDGQVRLWPTMLYSALEGLLQDGWIEELSGEGKRPPGRSRKRRYYRITERGRSAVASETARLSQLVRIARRHNAIEEETA